MITVVRRDLSHGYQTAQSGHAIVDWAFEHPRTFRRWRKKSGYLICLSVRNKEELEKLIEELAKNNLKYTKFYEPDIGELTAIAITPSDKADELTKRLQLANVSAGTKSKSTK